MYKNAKFLWDIANFLKISPSFRNLRTGLWNTHLITWQDGWHMKTFILFNTFIWQSLKLIGVTRLEILAFFYFQIYPLETNNLPPKNHTLFCKKKNYQNFSNLILLILRKCHYPIILGLRVMKYQSWLGHFVPPPPYGE